MTVQCEVCRKRFKDSTKVRPLSQGWNTPERMVCRKCAKNMAGAVSAADIKNSVSLHTGSQHNL